MIQLKVCWRSICLRWCYLDLFANNAMYGYYTAYLPSFYYSIIWTCTITYWQICKSIALICLIISFIYRADDFWCQQVKTLQWYLQKIAYLNVYEVLRFLNKRNIGIVNAFFGLTCSSWPWANTPNNLQ